MSEDVNPYADKTPKRSRDWCFTIWLHKADGTLVDELEWEIYKDDFVFLEPKIDKATYLIYQYEIGGKQKHLHIQGYIEFKHAVSLQGVKNKLAKWSGEKSPSLRKRRGTRFEASSYCRKSDTKVSEVFEFGETPQEDELPIMAQAFQILRQNKGRVNEELVSEKFLNHTTMYVAKWKNILSDIENAHWVQRTEYQKPKVILLYGKTRTGKSRRANANGAFSISVDSQWPFNEYRGQPIVVFDDYRGELKIGYFLKLLDGHPISVPIQYSGNKPWIPKRIYITSNEHPKNWYPKLAIEQPETYAALLGRFDVIDYYDKFREPGNDLDNDDIEPIQQQPVEQPQLVDITDLL